jgi:CBS domain-containing protein
MMPFVGFARLYSLRHAVADTNTFDRLSRLHEKGFLSRSSLEEITDAYAFLMQTRLRHQALAVARQETPDNVIQPKTLSPSEETLIKKTLAHVSVLAKKVSFDFPGSQQM